MKGTEQKFLEETYEQMCLGVKTVELTFDLLDEGLKDFILSSLKKAVPYVVAAGIFSGVGNKAQAQTSDGMFNVSSKKLYSSLSKEDYIKQQQRNLQGDAPVPYESQYATMTKKDQIDLGNKIQQLHNVYIEVIKEQELQTGFITVTVEIEGEVFAMTQDHANNVAVKLVKQLLEKNNMSIKDLRLIQEDASLQLFPFKIRANINVPKK
jgi:hypothetical protein